MCSATGWSVWLIFTRILNVMIASSYSCLVQLLNGLVRLQHLMLSLKVPWKRWSSVNTGPWWRTFYDITGMEKSCVVKAKKRKKWRKNVVSFQLKMYFPQARNVWKFAMFKNFIHSQLLKLIFCPRTVVKLRQPKIIKLQNILFLPSCKIIFCSTIIFTTF